jgi:hypothetical protein
MTKKECLPNQNDKIEIEAAAAQPKDDVRLAEFLIDPYKKVIREIARFLVGQDDVLILTLEWIIRKRAGLL